MAYLKHLVNGEAAGIIELGDRVVIGRRENCDLVIDDPTVSSQHAEISRKGSTFKLSDLKSTNGVRIGSTLVQNHLLSNEDKFVLGVHEFIFLETLPVDLEKTLKIKKSWIPGIYYTERQKKS